MMGITIKDRFRLEADHQTWRSFMEKTSRTDTRHPTTYTTALSHRTVKWQELMDRALVGPEHSENPTIAQQQASTPPDS